MDPEARELLAEIYGREAGRLAALLGRPLPWEP
jgi:hypothetical protein